MKKPKKIKVVKVKFVPPPGAPDDSMPFAEMLRLENLQPQPNPELAASIDVINKACYTISQQAGAANVPASLPKDLGACGPWSAVMPFSQINNAVLHRALADLDHAQSNLAAILGRP